MTLSPPSWLSEDAAQVWEREAPRWAALGHLEPVDATVCGMYAEVLARRQRLLDQISNEDLSTSPVALEMLRELTEEVADLRRELMLPT